MGYGNKNPLSGSMWSASPLIVRHAVEQEHYCQKGDAPERTEIKHTTQNEWHDAEH